MLFHQERIKQTKVQKVLMNFNHHLLVIIFQLQNRQPLLLLNVHKDIGVRLDLLPQLVILRLTVFQHKALFTVLITQANA